MSRKGSGQTLQGEQLLQVIREVLTAHQKVIFNGNNYSKEWHEEAQKRGLPNLRDTVAALSVLKDPKTAKLLSDLSILTESEVKYRYNIHLEHYIKVRLIELETLQELVSTHIYPAAMLQITQFAKAVESVRNSLGDSS